MRKPSQSDLTLLIPEADWETPAPGPPAPSPPAPRPPAPGPPCTCTCSCTCPRPPAPSVLSWKLVLLLTIATLALASILVISHQLIARHLLTTEGAGGVTLRLNIPDSGWMSDEGLHRALQHPSTPLEEEEEGEEEEEEEEEPAPRVLLRPEGEELRVRFHSPLSLENSAGRPLVEDGMYWSPAVEAAIPEGLPEEEVQGELAALRARRVSGLEDPTWVRCGREQNRFVRFQDGSSGCARYREPHTELVLGELLSFCLARLLGLTNVPAVVLSQVDPNSPVWSSALPAVSASSWRLGSVVALTPWQPSLVRTAMPALLRQALLARSTIDVTSDQAELRDPGQANLRDLTVRQAAEVAQWSDLVVFDYLTGNYDRVASMQDAAEKESRPEVLSETVHNLAASARTRGLWLLDNESGLLDAYSLLYPAAGNGPAADREGKRFRSMARDLLQTTCIFRRGTVDRVFRLYRAGDAAGLLDAFAAREEPLYRELLQGLPGVREAAFRDHFQGRLSEVWTWMKQCQENVRFW